MEKIQNNVEKKKGKKKWALLALLLLLLGGGSAAGTTIVVNKIAKQQLEILNKQIINDIWNEKFLNQLIRPIYHKNLIKQFNKELKRHNINEVSLVDPSLSDQVLLGKTSIKVLQNDNEFEFSFGEFLEDNKQPTFNENQTICTDMGWGVFNAGSSEAPNYAIALNSMPPTVEQVPDKNPWFINALVQTFSNNQNETIKGIENWDTSNITIMSSTFSNAKNFNQDINSWDVSNVTNMIKMFENASAFNKSLDKWNVSSVEFMNFMFSGAKSFNQDISKWNTLKLKSLLFTFWNAESFDQNLNDWNTSNLVALTGTFSGAKSFNQDLNKWNTSKVIQMVGTFQNAESFNGDITTWDLSSVNEIDGMFENAKSFNKDISTREIEVDGKKYKAWDTSNISSMNEVFLNASSFDHNISNWNVDKVKERNVDRVDEDGSRISIPTFSDFARGSKLTEEKLPKFVEKKEE
ncbi:BspA family leucine-rich repeat surface protein [Mycoplasma cottewii]|uniref:BspA family leucine-rich repeat surface protein n=1 Tax=Mycoplasma cottewii TaxID=51364 RepID=A0ABY5TXJ2_9MOLU|nr:BspA family leucine-rich repeat surface protein [Mycoplasma cottewii]UWD35390.1 BspA family leucine-rich repeat surface protein [Mycoplasma cottewii]